MIYKLIQLDFEPSWVLSKKDNTILPINDFIHVVEKIYDVDILDTSLTSCEIVVKNNVDEKELREKVLGILLEKLEINETDSVYKLSISDYDEKMIEEKKTVEKNNTEVDTKEPQSKSAIEKINDLIGADEFKKFANEFVKLAPIASKYNTLDILTKQSYIFSINDGSGLTTYLNLFAELLGELKLSSNGKKYGIIEYCVKNVKVHQGQDPFSSVKALYGSFGSKADSIICLDISEWMTKTNTKAFRDLLIDIDKNANGNIVIFKIPFVEKAVLSGIKQNIKDVLFIRDISFIPFNNDELSDYAKIVLEKRGFTLEDDVWPVFKMRITEEKNDGRFYGINTVNKIINEMIYLKQLNNVESNVEDAVIKKSEICNLVFDYHNDDKPALEELDGFIGIEPIKQRVVEIVAQIEASINSDKMDTPCIHMRFIGNPGTGKTTIARVLGKILKEKGILRHGSFFECTGRDLCGEYVGETAPKTSAVCRDAYGSILFIDEAYTLFRNDGRRGADYGREAIDTLISEMENHRTDLVVIMAGYPDDMDYLLHANAGLESRMPYVIEFPNYTREQLFEIFMLMVNKSFRYDDAFEDVVKDYFINLPDEIICAPNFSNARYVRNLFERTWGKAILRAQMNKQDEIILTKEDFVLASSEKEFAKIVTNSKKPLGFI